MASVNRDEEQRWVPTHVQVLVIRARGLRAKGKHGTNDAYTVVQLGKEKYSTCVMEKTMEPEWGEECTFELQPGVLDDASRDSHPTGTCDLTFTVMHRALIGLDVFLGQSVIALDKAFRERVCMRNEWYKLHSKTAKKEKERGELQITVQFTRHNLTASMYDLSIKDKPRSAFIRLRERMRARKRTGDEESSSAIVPGGYGALARMRGRLPSDGGGEEDYEDDEGGEMRRSKMRSYFLHGRLRKSSDTRSSTSLGSESSESSSRGGSLSPTAGISVVVSDLSNSPSNSSNLTADNSPDHTVAPSPLVSPVRHVFDEVCDLSIPVPHSLSSYSDAPILLPSVCVNGNPVETSPLTHQPPSLVLQQPKPQTETQPEPPKSARTSPLEKGKPTQAHPSEIKPQSSPGIQTWQPKMEPKSKLDLQFPAVGLLQKGSTLSLSLQNLSRRKEEQQGGGPLDGRRWSFDKPGEEEKAAIAAALEHTGLMADETVVETAVTVSETEVLGKKKRSLFSHSRAEKEETVQAPPAAEGRHRGWFSSKDPYSKPSQQAAPQTDSSSTTTIPPLSLSPTDLSNEMIYQHTNPFTSVLIISPTNPFFSLLQKNPFFQELHTITPLTAALPFLCSPAIDQPEVSVSSPRNPTPPQHLLNAGTLVDGSSHNRVNSSCRNYASNESHKGTPRDDFFGNRLKVDSKIDSRKMTGNTEPTNPMPTCAEGDLIVSNKADALVRPCSTNPACTLIVDTFPCFEAEAESIRCRTRKTDPKSFSSQDASEFEIDSPLPLNSSTEFSEHSTLSNLTFNKEKVSADSLCQINITPNTTAVLSAIPKPLTYSSESFDYLSQDERSDHEKVKCLSSMRQREENSRRSVEILKTSLPSCKFDILEALPEAQSNFRLDDGTEREDGDVELKESANKERICLDGHTATYPLGLSIFVRPSDSVVQGKLMMEKDAAGNPVCVSLDRSEVRFVGEGFDIENLEDSSMDSSYMSFTKEDVSDLPPNSSKGNVFFDGLPEPTNGIKIETANGSRQRLSSAPGHVLFNSLYKSVDSEQYLSCMSQHSSQLSPVANLKSDTFQEAKPKSGSSYEVLLTNAKSQRTISELQLDPESVSSPNPCDIVKEAIIGDVTEESIQKNASPVDTHDLLHDQIPDTFEMMTTRAGEELLILDPYMFLDIGICSEPNQSLCEQYDDALEDLGIITDFCQSTENMCNDVAEPKSSITQDLITTDLLLENVFVAQPPVTHTVGTSPVTHTVPREPWHMELCLDSIKTSQISKNTQATTNPASIPQGEHLDSYVYQPPLPEPSTLDWLNSGHDLLMSSHLSLLNLLPIASSSPHVAIGINSLPLFPFPMAPAPANLLPHTALASAALPPVFAASHDPFPQEEHQVSCDHSSPHPVKPLTPPDEKRSEGRSMLEKLKSTIHPGRSHQGDQESEKKLLVEGGGSYYHLNHSELVSLLLQRDADLQQEREEYDRRGLLLEKREVELKKMKILIRDLEDYIDTLLVRIMEQTPALLQVRSKMK